MNAAALPHLRIFQPHPGLFAYYDGRAPGYRFMSEPNWVDDGAISLGIATYALVSGSSALIYDTHVSVAHGAAIRAHLEGLGVSDFTVIYSHWHLDHVAGTEAFDASAVIANDRTAYHLSRQQADIEAGTGNGPPAISPLILPTRTYSARLDLDFFGRQVVLIEANIHSDDATVLWLPDDRILLAGDTVEDCVTYVCDPAAFETHLTELDRLASLGATYVLPNHGSPAVIESGGYRPDIFAATQRYIRWLTQLKDVPAQVEMALVDVIHQDLKAGALHWFSAYEDVHVQNVARTLKQYKHG